MSTFTPEEKKSFRFRKHLKDKAIEYLIIFIKNIILTEIVVWAVGSDKFLTGFIMALGYSAGWVVFELVSYKKDWLDIEIKDGKK